MEQNFNKRFIEWRDIDEAIERLAINITNSEIGFDAVNGIPRGGLIPAIMLSHKLGLPYSNFPSLKGNILLVDDICDSGKTLERYKFETHIYTVTLHYKQSASYEPNFWWRLAPENEWIVYPWENKNSKTIQDYATKGE